MFLVLCHFRKRAVQKEFPPEAAVLLRFLEAQFQVATFQNGVPSGNFFNEDAPKDGYPQELTQCPAVLLVLVV